MPTTMRGARKGTTTHKGGKGDGSKVNQVFENVHDAVDKRKYFKFGYILPKITAVLLAAIVMTLSHVAGSLAYKRIISASVNLDDVKGSTEGAERVKRGALQSIGKLVYYAFVLTGVVMVLKVFGLDVTSILALIGTIGFILGMSMQGTLSDITSGFLLSFFQTYNVGDIVRAGELEGLVTDFRLVNTVLLDIESRTTVSVPNSQMQGSVVHNFSLHDFYVHELELNFSNSNIGFDDLLHLLVRDLADSEKYPEIVRTKSFKPQVNVSNMKGWSTQVSVRVPLRPGFDMLQERKRVFSRLRNTMTEEGIQTLSRGFSADGGPPMGVEEEEEDETE